MSLSRLPASQAKNISLRVVLPASYILHSFCVCNRPLYQDINHVATRHQSLRNDWHASIIPRWGRFKQKTHPLFGRKKKTLNELKIFRWPLSPVHHRYILRNQAPPNWVRVFSDPKNGGFIPNPTEFWTQGKTSK